MSLFTTEQISQQLSDVKGVLASADIQNIATKATEDFKSLNTAVIGSLAGELNSGIKSLTAIKSDFGLKDVSGKSDTALRNSTTSMQNLQHQIPSIHESVCELTEALPGLTDKIVPILGGTTESTASAITGSGVTGAFTNINFAVATAQGLAPSIKKMTDRITGVQDINGSEVENVLQSAVGAINLTLPENLAPLIELSTIDINLNVVGAKLTEFTSGISGLMSGLIPTITDLPVLDTLHKLNNSTALISAAFPQLDSKILATINVDILDKLTNNKLNEALDLLKLADIGLSDTEISLKLDILNSQIGSIGAMLDSPLGNLTQTNPVLSIGQLFKGFTMVNSTEELDVEYMNMQRPIKSAVFHWSETYNDQFVTAEDIKKIAGSVEYHYIILKNGAIQRGKPVNDIAQHVSSEIDKESISVLLIGGYNALKGEVANLSTGSINSDQIRSLERLIGVLYDAFPGIKMYGHGELDENVSPLEPGVDIGSLIKRKFDKTNEETPTPIRSYNGNAGAGSIIPRAGVIHAYQGKIRNLPPQQRLVEILHTVHKISGYSFKIYSAGQMYKSEWETYSNRKQEGNTYFIGENRKVRQGSTRHDGGYAVDVEIYDASGKQLISNASYNNQIVYVIGLLRQQGITGIGAGGRGYMGGNYHLDISRQGGCWGYTHGYDSAPQWLKDLY